MIVTGCFSLSGPNPIFQSELKSIIKNITSAIAEGGYLLQKGVLGVLRFDFKTP